MQDQNKLFYIQIEQTTWTGAVMYLIIIRTWYHWKIGDLSTAQMVELNGNKETVIIWSAGKIRIVAQVVTSLRIKI